jgi:hypothetical protein
MYQMGTYINKQVLPQAPSPTMTSFRRISAIVTVVGVKSKGATGSREMGMRLSDADNLESQV